MIRFAPYEVYASLFDPPEAEAYRLDSELASPFCKRYLDALLDAEGQIRKDWRILCVGFGAGRLDIPFIDALSLALSEHVPDHTIEAVALEPFWDYSEEGKSYGEAARDRFKEKGYLESTDNCFRSDEKGITVEVEIADLESWLRQNPNQQFDVVLCFFVIHLMEDWKKAVADLLERLTDYGVIAFGENTGSVVRLAGSFATSTDADFTPWDHLWWKLYSFRDELLIPRGSIVSPRSLTFLRSTLSRAGMQLVPGDHEKTIDVRFDKHVHSTSVRKLIEGIKEGPNAMTFGTLRILDKTLAEEFANQALTCLEENFSQYQLFAYELGICVFGAVKRPEQGDTYGIRFLRSVSELARSGGPYSTARARGEVKRILAIKEGKEGVALPRHQALHAVMESTRASLALTRNTLSVITTRRASVEEYITAITLLPERLLGDEGEGQARAFLKRYSLYVAGEPQYHLSRLLQQDELHRRGTEKPPWGDLYIHIDLSRYSTDELKQVAAEDQPSLAKWVLSPEGRPLLLRLVLPSDQVKEFQEQIAPLVKEIDLSDYSLEEAWENWESGAFQKPWIRLKEDGREVLLRSIKENSKGIDNFVRIDQVAKNYSWPLVEATVRAFDQCAVLEEMDQDDVRVILRPLWEVISMIYRIALIDWKNEEEAGSSFFFSAVASAYPGRIQVSSGLLLSLSKCDAITYALRSSRELQGDSLLMRAGFPYGSEMIGAIQSSLAFLQDIEMADYAEDIGREQGSEAQKFAVAHEMTSPLDELGKEVNKLSDVGKRALVYMTLWVSFSRLKIPRKLPLVLDEVFKGRDTFYEFAFRLGYYRAARTSWVPKKEGTGVWSVSELWKNRNKWLKDEIVLPSVLAQQREGRLTVIVAIWLLFFLSSSIAHSIQYAFYNCVDGFDDWEAPPSGMRFGEVRVEIVENFYDEVQIEVSNIGSNEIRHLGPLESSSSRDIVDLFGNRDYDDDSGKIQVKAKDFEKKLVYSEDELENRWYAQLTVKKKQGENGY